MNLDDIVPYMPDNCQAMTMTENDNAAVNHLISKLSDLIIAELKSGKLRHPSLSQTAIFGVVVALECWFRKFDHLSPEAKGDVVVHLQLELMRLMNERQEDAKRRV